MCRNQTGKRKPRNAGRFLREDFHYDPKGDLYRCPNGKELKFSTNQHRDEKLMYHYRSLVPICAQCTLCKRCMPDKTPYRTISRWKHEAVIEDHRQRVVENGPEMMRRRAAICEYIFGLAAFRAFFFDAAASIFRETGIRCRYSD